MLKVVARPRRPGLEFAFWMSSEVLRESSVRPRLRRSSTIIWKPPVWPRPRMGGGITTKASASWIPASSRLRLETIRSWVSPLLRSLPVLVHDEGGGHVRDVGEVQDGESPDGHPAGEPVRLLEERGDLLRDRARPGLRRALGQDGHQDRVPLVLGGEKPGGLAHEAPGGHPDDDREEHDHEHRALHHPRDDAHVDLGHALERPVEPAVEPVRPLVAARPQPQARTGPAST